jgi:dihydroflavonol-4-reductase
VKAAVTGATGFIGANVARALLAEGHSVRVLARPGSRQDNIAGLPVEVVYGDLLRQESLGPLLEGADVLFHVAAAYTFWSPRPAEIYAANVDGTASLLKLALKSGIKKVVFTSSESTVHIAGRGQKGDESGTASTAEVAGAYKKSKVMAERIALGMCNRGLPLVVVNPTTPVGEFDVKPTPTGQVIVNFLKGGMPAYVDTGLNIVDVADVARGHLLAAEKGRIGERYILGNRNMTLKELLDMLARITGRQAPSVRIPVNLALAAAAVDEFVFGGILRREPHIPLAAVRTSRKMRYFDCSKAVTELGMPQSPVEDALERAVSWFRDNGYIPKDRGNGD